MDIILIAKKKETTKAETTLERWSHWALIKF